MAALHLPARGCAFARRVNAGRSHAPRFVGQNYPHVHSFPLRGVFMGGFRASHPNIALSVDVHLFGAYLSMTFTCSERSYTRRALFRGWSRPAKKHPAKNPCRFFAGTPDLHIGQGQSAEPKVQRLLRAQRVNRVGQDVPYASNAPSLREAGALQVA